MRKFLAALLLTSLSFSTLAQDTTIRILGVMENGDTAAAILNLGKINTVWNSSGIPSSVTTTIANFGAPVPLGSSLVGGTAEAQRLDAISKLSNLRSAHQADIIIVFVDDIPVPSGLACGYTAQDYWTSEDGIPANFVITNSPLQVDRRGADTFFVALVATDDSLCEAEVTTAAHEFGHLLGAGHDRTTSNSGTYFYPSSHADIRMPNPRLGIDGWKTVMSRPNPPGCGTWGQNCPYEYKYSSTQTGMPSTTLNVNVDAIGFTAYSVANYVLPQATCSLTTPYNINGFVLYGGACYPSEYETAHQVNWSDLCPQAVTYYNIWAQQPAGNGAYFIVGPTGPIPQSVHVYVSGSAARIKVGGCSGVNCTGPSFQYYTADTVCNP